MTTKKSNASSLRKLRAAAKSDDTLLEKLMGGPLTLGIALMSIRETLGVTQSEFARKLGVTRGRLCDLEKGRRSVSIETAADFARRLGHPIETMVKLALQDQVRKAHLRLTVDVRAA